jgi:ABC-type sugar transport system ATPase subunit
LLLLCHRIIVMAEGQLVEAFDPGSERMDGLMTRLLAANDALRIQGLAPSREA